MSKEVNRNNGLYKEKQLKLYFTLSKHVRQVELVDIRTNNPQIQPMICNQRIMERMVKYRECREKVQMLNRFYFKLKLKYPLKLEEGNG